MRTFQAAADKGRRLAGILHPARQSFPVNLSQDWPRSQHCWFDGAAVWTPWTAATRNPLEVFFSRDPALPTTVYRGGFASLGLLCSAELHPCSLDFIPCSAA